jgi:hypothetical protein
MDIIEKAQALQNLVAVYRDLGDMEALDAMLAAVRKATSAEQEEQAEQAVSRGRRTGIKRGPYKTSGMRMALMGSGVITLEDLVPLVEQHQHVPGRTVEAKGGWLAGQMRKSKHVYREWPDGRWSLRSDNSPGPKEVPKEGPKDGPKDGPNGSAPTGK